MILNCEHLHDYNPHNHNMVYHLNYNDNNFFHLFHKFPIYLFYHLYNYYRIYYMHLYFLVELKNINYFLLILNFIDFFIICDSWYLHLIAKLLINHFRLQAIIYYFRYVIFHEIPFSVGNSVKYIFFS